MKIMFLNPPFTRLGGLEGQGGKVAPLNIAYLASYLRKYSKREHEICIIDAEGLRYSYKEVERDFKSINPDMVAITMPTPAYYNVVEIAKIIKKHNPRIFVVVGGPHPSALPTEVLEDTAEIDFAIAGEGEASFTKLVDTLGENGDPKDIEGLTYRSDGQIIHNPSRFFIKDLDAIPFPARDLLPNKLYQPSLAKRIGKRDGPLINMLSSRGCPYDCIYCESKVIWSRRPRLRSPRNIVDEMEECVKKYNAAEINFHDDIFSINRERTLEICRLIQERKLDIPWCCMTRVDFVWEDVLAEMKRAGCGLVNFGFESGSDEILKSMNKNTTVKAAREAMKICKKIGIRTMGNFMIGNIGETEETIRQTINFAKELNTDTMGVFVAIPYPGTDLFKKAENLGYLKKGLCWRDFCIVSSCLPPMRLPNLSPERLRYWQSKAIREFYFRPSYILKRFFEIRTVSDMKTLFDGILLYLRLLRRA
ncbi:MAG: radical SAM protein [Candidatus Omnitrophica bacterium]|nr:radical SAM protein [Candidatus Omnitrophota bacterium]